MSEALDTMEDLDLVKAFQEQGREEAFDELVRRYQSLVINMAYQMIHNYDEALEAAQDVFVKVYRALPEFQARAAFKTWLYTITRRVVLNALRKLRSRKAGSHESLQHEELGEILAARPELTGHSTPGTELLSTERLGQLTEALAQLDEDQREVMVLRAIHELSYEQIAEITGVNVGTVKSRIARARDQLRKILENKGIYGQQ